MQASRLMKELNDDDRLGRNMKDSMSYTQRDLCSAHTCFHLDYKQWGFLTKKTWITSIWSRLQPEGIRLMGGWNHPRQREGDKHLGDLALAQSRQDRIFLHKIFGTLEFTTLADITVASGRKIHPDAVGLKRITGRISNLLRGNKKYRMTSKFKQAWARFLSKLTCDHLYFTLPERMGKWMTPSYTRTTTYLTKDLQHLLIDDTEQATVYGVTKLRGRGLKFEATKGRSILVTDSTFRDSNLIHVDLRTSAPIAREWTALSVGPDLEMETELEQQESNKWIRYKGEISFDQEGDPTSLRKKLGDNQEEMITLMDGSIKDGRGSYGGVAFFTLPTRKHGYSSNKREERFSLVGPVDGPVDSNRSEMCGPFSAALHLQDISRNGIQIRCKFRFVMDNDMAYNKLQLWTNHFNMKYNPDDKYQDILQAFRIIMRGFKEQSSFQWICSHKEKEEKDRKKWTTLDVANGEIYVDKIGKG